MKNTYYKELLFLSSPLLLSSLSTTLANLLSVPILGKYGVNAMAASAISSSIMIIFTNVFLASYTGIRILGSKAYGANDQNKIDGYFKSSFTLGIIIAFFMVMVIFLLGRDVVNFMSKAIPVQELAFKMLKISSLSLPILAVSNLLFIKFNLEKNTKYSLYITVVANILGMITSMTLVYGYKIIPSYGGVGVALAALIQSILVCVMCIGILMKKKLVIQLGFEFKHIKRLV